jgi:phosphate starvation-inducible PhoH-like protein
VRGNEITVEGPEASVVGQVFSELVQILEGGQRLGEAEVIQMIDMVKSDERPSEVLSTHVLKAPNGRIIRAKSFGQKTYVETVRNNIVTFAIGPAGTGKTWLAVALAVEALLAKQVRRIVLTRPAVEAGERLGFLPGDLMAKVDPYLRPLYDALYDMFDLEAAERLFEKNSVEVAPLAFMRGRTLNDSFIILDEAQNTTPEQMKMFLTRIGFGSRVVVTGDVTQTDVPGGKSGLHDVQHTLNDVADVAFVHLGGRDIVRHRIVRAIVNAYEQRDRAQQSP